MHCIITRCGKCRVEVLRKGVARHVVVDVATAANAAMAVEVD